MKRVVCGGFETQEHCIGLMRQSFINRLMSAQLISLFLLFPSPGILHGLTTDRALEERDGESGLSGLGQWGVTKMR